MRIEVRCSYQAKTSTCGWCCRLKDCQVEFSSAYGPEHIFYIDYACRCFNAIHKWRHWPNCCYQAQYCTMTVVFERAIWTLKQQSNTWWSLALNLTFYFNRNFNESFWLKSNKLSRKKNLASYHNKSNIILMYKCLVGGGWRALNPQSGTVYNPKPGVVC